MDTMIPRRTVLCWLLSGAAAWPLRGVRLHAQAAALSDRGLAILRAIAPAVLPTELGAAGHDKVVNDFVQWLASYRSGAERSWGYGHPRRSGTPAIDPGAYDKQLLALDERARAGAGALATVPVDVRRTMVTAALDAAGVRTLPGAPNGQQVVADFMSFFFTSSAAVDLAYRARIGQMSCRGLAGAAARPRGVEGD
jgi:hypothetical protein